MIAHGVTLSPVPDAPVGDLARAVIEVAPAGVEAALDLALRLGERGVVPGAGQTAELWEALATAASIDLGVARAIEPHLDAMAILAEAGVDDADGGTWGVFAAEGGDDPLHAHPVDGDWSLTGTKAWCSLAGRLSNALVTAHLDDGRRGLFAVSLRDDGVHVREGSWKARGLAEVPSGPVEFFDVRATAIGEPGWYLSRPGFAWGGIGVAACWYGGAVGLARRVLEIVGTEPPPLQAMHLGAVDELLQSSRRALAEAAALIDDGPAHASKSILAKRVRATVARACEEILMRAGHAVGPAPLALDEQFAKVAADLQLYVRQHHAERDEASLGTAIARLEKSPW